MVLLPTVHMFLFMYLPIYGLTLAFKDYRLGDSLGLFGSHWVGLEWFKLFLSNPMSWRLFRNTFLLGLTWIVFYFPAPILLAFFINEIRSSKVKRTLQTISYLPYFISTVIIVGIMKELFSLNGNVNHLIGLFGVRPIDFFSEPAWFRPLYIFAYIWQQVGFGSIIYLAALTNISPELYEAAVVDGATRLQKLFYITIPGIIPTVSILFIINMGRILSNDYQMILLMYNPLTYATADVIDTYVYREGISNFRYSYGTAVSLFLYSISFVFVYFTNWISRKISDSENSLW